MRKNIRYLFRKSTIIFYSTLLLSVFIITIVYPWFTKEQESVIEFPSDKSFKIELIASFIHDGTNIPITEASEYYDPEKRVILADGSDASKVNYIDKLRVKIKITSKNVARLRVKILDEWRLIRTYQSLPDPIESVIPHERLDSHGVEDPIFPFKYSTDFNYKLDEDSGYIYYTQMIEKDAVTIIDWIVGGMYYPAKTTPAYSEQCLVSIDFIIDVVQANRFVEVWGIDENFYEA